MLLGELRTPSEEKSPCRKAMMAGALGKKAIQVCGTIGLKLAWEEIVSVDTHGPKVGARRG